MRKTFKRLSGRVVYQCPWFKLIEDKVIYPGGKGTYSYVDKKPAAVILAFTKKDEFYIVGQWRYPTKKYSWEIPIGTASKGESPLVAAKRELGEEIGMKAKRWKEVGVFYFADGMCNQAGHVFAARVLSPVKIKGDDWEELAVKKVTTSQFEKMIKDNLITDGPSIAAYYQAKLALGL